ncbi:MAG: hypothetical protein ACRCVG_02515 [Methanobacteriaceae archaeon]
MKFIVIDGIDGSGKDTQAKLIYNEFLKKESEKVSDETKKTKKIVLRSHPNDDNVLGRVSHVALLKKGKINILIAATFYFLDVIRSLIIYYPRTDVLIFSRYLLAIIYLPNTVLIPFYKFFSFILPNTPDMFFLKVSPDEALSRVLKRNSVENGHNFSNSLVNDNFNDNTNNISNHISKNIEGNNILPSINDPNSEINTNSNDNTNNNNTNNGYYGYNDCGDFNDFNEDTSNKLQIFENKESLSKCSEKALIITKDWNIINGNKELNEVTEEIKSCLFLNDI